MLICLSGPAAAVHAITETTTTSLYHLYGLTLESELDLPEVLRASAAAAPEISVRLGPLEPGGLAGGRQLGPFLWAAPGALWLRVPDVARFLITGGNTIVVDPHPGIDEDSVRVFLLGSALGALLHQRGMVVLHGNAIRLRDGCLVCVGPSGAGKSTLAAEFLRRGYRILADDVVPVDNEGRAVPGFPRLKLWQDAAERLDISTDGLRAIRPQMPKFNFPLDETQFSTEPARVRWIYVLNAGFNIPFGSTPVRGMDCLNPLRLNTYRFGYLDGMGLRPVHLKGCARLASQAEVRVLTRPEQGVEPRAVADLILDDLGVHA